MNKSASDLQMPPGSARALLPIAVFIILFCGSGILSGNFYAIPMILVFMAALFTALLQNRSVGFYEKLAISAEGAGDPNIIIMCLVYLLAGGFAGIACAAGGVAATVNLALSFIPAHLSVVGLFLMGCFISMAMGTSVGTVAALTPIAADVAGKTGFSLPMTVGAVVCGAMFGDNLSFISDTTIAAVRTQGCDMRDKFKANFFLVLPPAVLTVIIFYVLTRNGKFVVQEDLSYDGWLVVPYLAILAGALCGINVFALLSGGIVLSAVIGVCRGTVASGEVFPAVGAGMAGMYEIAIIAVLVSCIGALVRYNGGFQWILSFVHRRMSGCRGAQFGIIFLVSLFDVVTANNTVAIILAGPMAKQISEKYGIAPSKSASLLDIFGSVFQGMLPYGAQLLSAAKLAGITSLMIVPHMYYTFLMGGTTLLFVAFSKKNKSTNPSEPSF